MFDVVIVNSFHCVIDMVLVAKVMKKSEKKINMDFFCIVLTYSYLCPQQTINYK